MNPISRCRRRPRPAILLHPILGASPFSAARTVGGVDAASIVGPPVGELFDAR
jgi:hypothetical protein